MAEKTLDQLFKEINKEAGFVSVSKGIPDLNFSPISLGSPTADYVLYGGIPRGRLSHFYGPKSCGKTTTAIICASNYTKEKNAKKVLIVDNEYTLDENWVTTLGLNLDNVIVYRPVGKSAEDIFQDVIDFIMTNEVGFVVFDSVATLIPQQIYDESMTKQQIGGISKPLTIFCNRIIPYLAVNDCTMVIINQVRQDMNNPYNDYVTPGGEAVQHAASVNLKFRQGVLLDENNEDLKRSAVNPFGHVVEIKLEKSKVCRMDRKLGTFTLNYKKGVDYTFDTVIMAIQLGLIQQSGAWYTIVDLDTGEILNKSDGSIAKFQGKTSMVKYLYENKDLFDKLSSIVYHKIREK